jgi:hypothetical protein
MHYRKLLLAAAIVVPSAGVFVAAGTASAAGTPKGTGTLTCALAGTATFTPPLTPNGTPGFKREVIQFNLSASSCTGPGSDTPQPTPTSGTITTKPIKVADTGTGKSKVAGACGNSTFNPTLTLKSKETWVGATVKGTKTVIGPLTGNGGTGMEPGLTGTGTAKKSYAGSASATLYLSTPSVTEIQQVCKQGGSGSISEFDFDGTTSTITVG